MKQATEKVTSGALSITGRWINDGGTVIELRTHRDGRLSGTIRFGSDGSAYKLYQLKGTWITRPDGTCGIVGAVPSWPRPSTATVWLGELDAFSDTLSTKMLTAAYVDGGDAEASNGGSEFRRAPVRRRRSA